MRGICRNKLYSTVEIVDDTWHNDWSQSQTLLLLLYKIVLEGWTLQMLLQFRDHGRNIAMKFGTKN